MKLLLQHLPSSFCGLFVNQSTPAIGDPPYILTNNLNPGKLLTFWTQKMEIWKMILLFQFLGESCKFSRAYLKKFQELLRSVTLKNVNVFLLEGKFLL